MMQHEHEHEHPAPAAGEIEILPPLPSPLDHSAVLRALWPSLSTDDRRAMRLCCATLQDAVDAQAGCVEEGQPDKSPLLSSATCARLIDAHTLTLRSMAYACLRSMLLNHPAGAVVFLRLQSLHLHLVRARVRHACRKHTARSLPPCMHA
jgi:hypothetical protein